MNVQVREEIEDLRRRFGFEEREAGAAWHLRRAPPGTFGGRRLAPSAGGRAHSRIKESGRRGEVAPRGEGNISARGGVPTSEQRNGRSPEHPSALLSSIQRTRCAGVAEDLPGRVGWRYNPHRRGGRRLKSPGPGGAGCSAAKDSRFEHEPAESDILEVAARRIDCAGAVVRLYATGRYEWRRRQTLSGATK